MKFSIAFPAAFAAMLVGGSFAFADEVSKPPAPPAEKQANPPVVKAKGRVLLFGEGDGATRFHVERNAADGRMTFRQADPSMRIDAPVILMKTDSGPREVTLVADQGQPGVWVWSHDAVKADRFDGSMRVVVAGKTYTSLLGPVWTSETSWAPRYGGRILELSDCGAGVEIVQDPATGTLTIYSFEEVIVTEAPVITVKETSGPTTVTLTKVAGKPGVWVTKHERFKTTTTSATIRVLVNGKPCEVPLTYGPAGRGGQMVTVDGGPGFEVVYDSKAGYYTFYEVEETYNGKPYTIEKPTVVYNGRTYPLTRVEGERAWRLVGLDTAGSDARDGQLNFTLFGKTLSTRLGLSGLGLGVK